MTGNVVRFPVERRRVANDAAQRVWIDLDAAFPDAAEPALVAWVRRRQRALALAMLLALGFVVSVFAAALVMGGGQ